MSTLFVIVALSLLLLIMSIVSPDTLWTRPGASLNSRRRSRGIPRRDDGYSSDSNPTYHHATHDGTSCTSDDASSSASHSPTSDSSDSFMSSDTSSDSSDSD